MDPARYRRLKEILAGAPDRAGAERDAYLAEACSDDAALRAEAARLLRDTISTQDVAPEVDPDAAEAFGASLEAAAAPKLAETLGPYRLEHEIGRGGMGVVYAATDSRDGARVALKCIYPHLLASPGSLDRFRREARAGERVEHENVVRTLGEISADGESGPIHALVLEYVEGKTLRELVAELGTVPEGLLREIAVQAATGLAAIHAAGIVHRDLKPENLLITHDHRIRVMDLGIAKVEEATIDLTREGQFVGSLHYAAPEQFDERAIGPESDLYSLGVVLYELATGENPFQRDHPGAAMLAHLEATAPPAFERNPEISPFLSELLAGLLEKQVSARFATCEDLLQALEDGEGGPWWAQREARLRGVASVTPRIPVRRDTSVHGRAPELAILDEAWKDAATGKGASVLVVGEGGIGKSRLVDAFLSRRTLADSHVLYGSFPPTGGLGGVTDAILARFGGAGLATALRRHLDDAPALVSAFAALVRGEASPDGAAALAGDAVHSACAKLLRSLAADRPVVWVLEDLHFAPAAGRAVALSLARTAERIGALVILTTRPGLVAPEFEELRKLSHHTRLPLGRLSPREVVALLEEALGNAALAERLGPRMALKSDGVPFFVFEMIRALEEDGRLRRGLDGRYDLTRPIADLDVPDAVRDLIASRLSELSRDERDVVDAGAVAGHEFDADHVAAVLDRPFVRVLQDLAEVERRHGVVRTAGRRHRFDHHQFQEVVYASIPERLREEYHARFAEAHATRVGGGPETVSGPDAVVLASHHLRGSRPEAGLPFLDRALDDLVARHQREAAAELLDVTLAGDGLVEGARRAELSVRLSRLLGVLGRRESQLRAAEEARALSRQLDDAALQATAELAMGVYHLSLHESDVSLAFLERARGLAAAAGRPDVEIAARSALANAHVRLGSVDQAQIELEQARELARAEGDLRAECEAYGTLGTLLARSGRIEAARAELERARDLAVETGDRRLMARSECRLGASILMVGDVDDAEAHFRRALTGCADLGDRQLLAYVRGNLGLIALRRAQLGAADREFRAQLETGLEIGDRAAAGQALVNLANVRMALGDPEGAFLTADQAVEIARAMGDIPLQAHAMLYQAYLLRRYRDVPGARAKLDEALEFVSRNDIPKVAEARVDLGALSILEGDEDAARRELRRGYELAVEHEMPETAAYALLYEALLPGGDVEKARKALDELETGVLQREHALYLLWRASGDDAVLDELYENLEIVRANAPPDRRVALVENVPMRAEYVAAWEERQAGS